MSTTPILFAAGPRGITLNVPEGVALQPIAAPIDPLPVRSDAAQRALVASALDMPESGPPLAKLAAIKRRAVILAGDLSRPAPYDIALPVVVETLVKADIRPSRIAVIACPGGCGTLLGRAAIHRYGEEICGDHEVSTWPEDNTPPIAYSGADLRIAIASHMAIERFEAFLPAHCQFAEFGVDISLGKSSAMDIANARGYGTLPDRVYEKHPRIETKEADVWMTSGGGAPWEETLEEALLSFQFAVKLGPSSWIEGSGSPLDEALKTFARTHSNLDYDVTPTGTFPIVSAKTAVLVFSGAEGLGSSRFARDVWSLIEQAEEALAAGQGLGAPSKVLRFDPANVLADCLKSFSSTVLFAPELCEHSDGDEFLERLQAAPHVAARLNLCDTQENLWTALTLLHGEQFSLYAEPLGWRGR